MELPVEDTLEGIGIAAGAFLVLAGLATLVGMPWVNKGGGLPVAAANAAGAVGAVAIGAAIAWLVRQ